MEKCIKVSAIVSTYNSARFIQSCIVDLQRQTIAAQLEIIVIDSGSEENEGAIVKDFALRYDNIVYLRTEQREGLYTAWNRAIKMAKGKYITNANTDDRHHPSSFEILSKQLDDSDAFILAYHDQIISDIENETFEECLARNTRRQTYPDFSHETLILGCLTGSQPMWRKSAHLQYGYFSEEYKIAADYEFWLRISQTNSFLHIRNALGLFYDSPDTLSGSNNRFKVDTETVRIQLEYLKKFPWSVKPSNRINLSSTIFRIGYHYVEIRQDLRSAKEFLWQAWKLNFLNLNFAKTFIIRGLLKFHYGLGKR